MTNEREKGMEAKRNARFRYALATIFGTGAACALAAILALTLVAPRYEARIILAVPSPAGDALLEAARQAGAGVGQARDEAHRLSRRTLFADLRSGVATAISGSPAGIGSGHHVGSVFVSPDGDGVVVVALGASAEEAKNSAAGSTRSILDRWEAAMSGRNGGDVGASAIVTGETILGELQARLRALPELSSQSDLQDALQRAGEDISAAESELAELRARIWRMQSVLRSPDGGAAGDADPIFGDRLEAYRSLRAALIPLRSLPQDNPRRRTATARLEQLLLGLRERGEDLLQQWSRDEAAAVRRFEASARAEAQLRTALQEANRTAEERRALDRSIARAQGELAEIRMSGSEEVHRPPAVQSREMVRELSPPYLAAMVFAAVAGAAIAILALSLRGLVARRAPAEEPWNADGP